MHAEGGRDRGRGRQVKKRTYLVLTKNGEKKARRATWTGARGRNELMGSVDYCDNAINICPTADCLSDRLPTVAGKRRREDFARKNKNVGVHRDPSEPSEVWLAGKGREEVKSLLSRRV